MHPKEGVSFQKIQTGWVTILPTLVIAGLMVPAVFWIAVDKTVWPWDPAWYGEVSVELWYTLVHDPLRWPRLMLQAFGTKAPGTAWIGQFFVPFGQLLGSIELGLLLSILLVQCGTLILAYRIGREMSGGDILVGLAASMLVASAPLFTALSNVYLVEPLQLLAVTYFFWIAAAAYRWDRARILTHLLLAVALAMAAKVTSPLYCALPGVIACFHFFRSQRWVNSSSGSLPLWRRLGLLASLVLLSFTIAWYVKNFQAIIGFLKLASSSEVALSYGKEDVFLNKAGFWLSAMRANFFFPKVLLAFIALNLLILISTFRNRLGHARLTNKANILAAAGIIHVIAVLIAFSLNINEEQRYLLPLLPSIMVVLIWPLSYVPKRWFSIIALLMAAGQFATVQAQSLNVIPRNPDISYWLRTPNPDRQQMDELSRLVDLTSTRATHNRYVICGVEYPWLNANSLALYAAKGMLRTKCRCRFTSLGYAENDLDRAWQRLEQFEIVYFVSVEKQSQPPLPNFVNMISIATLDRIETDPRFVRRPFDSKFSIVVFRNTQVPLENSAF